MGRRKKLDKSVYQFKIQILGGGVDQKKKRVLQTISVESPSKTAVRQHMKALKMSDYMKGLRREISNYTADDINQMRVYDTDDQSGDRLAGDDYNGHQDDSNEYQYQNPLLDNSVDTGDSRNQQHVSRSRLDGTCHSPWQAYDEPVHNSFQDIPLANSTSNYYRRLARFGQSFADWRTKEGGHLAMKKLLPLKAMTDSNCSVCDKVEVVTDQRISCRSCQDVVFCSISCFCEHHANVRSYHMPFAQWYQNVDIPVSLLNIPKYGVQCAQCKGGWKPVNLIHFESGVLRVSVPLCRCDEQKQLDLLLQCSLFPASPSDVSTVVTVDTLELYDSMLCNAHISMHSFVQSIDDFCTSFLDDKVYDAVLDAFYQYKLLRFQILESIMPKVFFDCMACPIQLVVPTNDSTLWKGNEFWNKVKQLADTDPLNLIEYDIHTLKRMALSLSNYEIKIDLSWSKMLVSLDGCFKLMHRRNKGGADGDQITNIFFAKRDDLSTSSPPSSTCSAFNALRTVAERSSSALNDFTGLFGAFCSRHGCPCAATFSNIKSGEGFHYGDIALKNVIEKLDDSSDLLVFYDIACQFQKNFVRRVPSGANVQFLIPSFHLYAHQQSCIQGYDQKNYPGAGTCAGEIAETRWSSLGRNTFLREMAMGKRNDYLSFLLLHMKEESDQMVINTLSDRVDMNIQKYEVLVAQYDQLLQLSGMTTADVIHLQQGSDHISPARDDESLSLEQKSYSQYALLLVALYENAGNEEVLGQLVALERLLGVQRMDLNSAVVQNALQSIYTDQMKVALHQLLNSMIERDAINLACDKFGNTTKLKQRFRATKTQYYNAFLTSLDLVNSLFMKWNAYVKSEDKFDQLSRQCSSQNVQELLAQHFGLVPTSRIKLIQLKTLLDRTVEELVYNVLDAQIMLNKLVYMVEYLEGKVNTASSISYECQVVIEYLHKFYRQLSQLVVGFSKCVINFKQHDIFSVLQKQFPLTTSEVVAAEYIISEPNSAQQPPPVMDGSEQQIDEQVRLTLMVDYILLNEIQDEGAFFTELFETEVNNLIRASVGSLANYEHAIESCAPGEWLDDFAAHILLQDSTFVSPLLSRSWCSALGDIHSRFGYICAVGPDDVVYQRFRQDRMLFLDHQDHVHWTLYAIFKRRKQIVFYDPFQGDVDALKVKKYFSLYRFWNPEEDISEYQVKRFTNVSRQRDQYNCGVFCLIIAQKFITSGYSVINSFHNVTQQMLENFRLSIIAKLVEEQNRTIRLMDN
ncbi:hypothetical protein MP228_003224 [Amoeboaphelidium protococcarum]|nr:hypothetical protein MP228_008572 [Amoeboaphelidium protococcarum]KAI3646262.1 hypothetical protein MP228_009190 [Amoeboaphelidium protococcarum]KAI3651352.1 hypothetical protein MP228_003791 [Amoeboaphelidium protococcarum]KAI3651921.1 hypothetical protein MP228_003224 [Amoeboaphelidium protococcarum]